MTPTTSTFGYQLARLGEAITADGIEHYEAEIATLAARARRARTADVAAGVLVDRTAPTVVRERAFALVCRALSRLVLAPTGPVARSAA